MLMTPRAIGIDSGINGVGSGSASEEGLRGRGTYMFEGLFQPMHLLVILGIAILVFGPRKLPELGKGLGDGIRGFRSALKEEALGAEANEEQPPSSSDRLK
jgi:sec-independent protein translocase protein TatA